MPGLYIRPQETPRDPKTFDVSDKGFVLIALAIDLFAHVFALISRLVQHPRNSRHKNLNSESVGISAQIEIYPIKPFALFEWKTTNYYGKC